MTHARNTRRAYDIEARPTTYRLTTFKSRLEARWAAFWDNLGVTWLYEPKTFDIGGQWYIPDFYLPALNLWVEVKPATPNAREERMIEGVCKITRQRAVVLFGDCDINRDYSYDNVGYEAISYRPYEVDEFDDDELGRFEMKVMASVDVYSDDSYHWCICGKCGAVGIEYEGRGERVCDSRCFPTSDKDRNPWHPRILAAFEFANTVKFSAYERKADGAR